MLRCLLALAAFVLCAPVVRAGGDPLDDALFDKASSVIDQLKKKGFRNVGVVKFLVRHGDAEPSDDVGDLNLTLANKLEVALILANTDDKFGIIDKASDQVVREKLLLANHRTEEGRKAFFIRKYALAWSRDSVEPSGFLTAMATFSQDLMKLKIQLQVFDRSGKIEDIKGTVSVQPSPEMLAQAGFSYALAPSRQKALVTGDPPPTREAQKREILEQVAKSAAPKPKEAEAQPSPLTDCPVKWTVLYNSKPVTLTGTSLAEPKDTDRVEFTLSNPTQGTYAVVLLVNGENTLYQERIAPAACRKWVLGPNMSITIRGFQTGADKVAPFRVLPPDEPLPDAVRYGDHAGTFRMVVFHGKMSETNPADNVAKANPEDAAALAMSRTRGGTRLDGLKPQTLKALQADLRGRIGTSGARRLCREGGRDREVRDAARSISCRRPSCQSRTSACATPGRSEGDRVIRSARCIACVLALLASSAFVRADETLTRREKGDLAIKARAILKKHCFECHGGPDSRGTIQVLEYSRLVATGPNPVPFVAPAKAADSQIVQFLEDGSMPPGDRPRPTE